MKFVPHYIPYFYLIVMLFNLNDWLLNLNFSLLVIFFEPLGEKNFLPLVNSHFLFATNNYLLYSSIIPLARSIHSLNLSSSRTELNHSQPFLAVMAL